MVGEGRATETQGCHKSGPLPLSKRSFDPPQNVVLGVTPLETSRPPSKPVKKIFARFARNAGVCVCVCVCMCGGCVCMRVCVSDSVYVCVRMCPSIILYVCLCLCAPGVCHQRVMVPRGTVRINHAECGAHPTRAKRYTTSTLCELKTNPESRTQNSSKAEKTKKRPVRSQTIRRHDLSVPWRLRRCGQEFHSKCCDRPQKHSL